MNKKKFLVRALVLGAAGVGLLSTSLSFGYALTATYILNRMAKNHAPIRTLEMEGKVTDVGNKLSFREITNIDFSSGKIRSLYLNEAGESLGEKTSKLSESHPMGLAWFGLACDSNLSRVESMIARLGITAKDDSNVKLTRIQTRPVFEIGDASILKIEKDDFLFASYQNDTKDLIEVESYSVGSAAAKLPKSIVFKKSEAIVFTYELKSFKLNTPYKAPTKTGAFRPLSPSIQGWNDLVH